jgi:hypothetical protein
MSSNKTQESQHHLPASSGPKSETEEDSPTASTSQIQEHNPFPFPKTGKIII